MLLGNYGFTSPLQRPSHGRFFTFGALVAPVLVLPEALLAWEQSWGLFVNTVPFVAKEA